MSNQAETELIQALEDFVQEQSRENKVRMVNCLMRTAVFVPGVFPPGTDPAKLPRPTEPGEKIQLPKDLQPLPAILKNQNGESYLPAYTSQSEISMDQKPQIVMNMPFMALVTMAVNNSKIDGIAINPFKQNILLKEPLLKALKEDEAKRMAAAKGAKQPVQMTPEQAKAFFRRKVETELMPRSFHEDPKSFTDTLCDEQEAFLRKQYERVYKNPEQCPYQQSAFSVMPLNIREGLLLIRLDLPEAKPPALVALRAYLLYSETDGRSEYFTIELSREKGIRRIGRVKADGQYEDLGEAPVEGAELQRMLDLYDFYDGGGN